ncbi:MAG: amidohydrolase [bacterium]
MDLLLRNGNIRTMDPNKPLAQALAVMFGKIAWVGSDQEAQALLGYAKEVMDLEGRTVLPGFIDSHNHFCMTAFLRSQVDCRATAGCLRSNEVVEALRQRAEKTPPGRWILGWGYASYLLEDKKELTRKDLDRASTRHPICLVHVSVHGAVVNTPGLKRLGYDRQSFDPPGGKILKDSNGLPNGILQESAIMGPLFFASPSIYSQVMGGLCSEERVEMMANCARDYNRLGIVAVHDPLVDPLTLRSFQDLEDKGKLTLRLRPYVLNQWAGALMDAGIGQGFGSERLKLGGIKIFLDGGMSSKTAAVSKPYVGGGLGILNYDLKSLVKEIQRFHQRGYRVSVHAQGDKALEILIKAFERCIQQGNHLRHHVVHAGNITPSQIERTSRMGLYISSQANFFSLLGDSFMEAYGAKRSQGLYPFKTLLSSGIRLALSSDSPVADPDPLVGLRDALLRKTASGRDLGPKERLTMEEALPLYNREAAYFSGEEHLTGTICVGKWADFVVMEKDPFDIPARDMTSKGVKMTFVAGKMVHRAA